MAAVLRALAMRCPFGVESRKDVAKRSEYFRRRSRNSAKYPYTRSHPITSAPSFVPRTPASPTQGTVRPPRCRGCASRGARTGRGGAAAAPARGNGGMRTPPTHWKSTSQDIAAFTSPNRIAATHITSRLTSPQPRRRRSALPLRHLTPAASSKQDLVQSVPRTKTRPQQDVHNHSSPVLGPGPATAPEWGHSVVGSTMQGRCRRLPRRPRRCPRRTS